MNAAARVMHQSNFFSGQFADIRLPKKLCMQIILLFFVLASAIAVVYVTNLQRLTLSQLQTAEQRNHRIQLQWGQLMLEQASLATPARVQQLATEKLHMELPVNKQTFILHVR